MAKKKKTKKEALTVSRFINEILVEQLRIPFKNIVNDTTFSEYTGNKRPDLLISEIAYNPEEQNDDEYIKHLLAYAEAKDDCNFDDRDWKDAYKQAKEKSKPDKLNVPFFIVTNLKQSRFYNSTTGKELQLNNNPIRDFQNTDVLRLINKRLLKNKRLDNISTNADTQSAISEAIFNKKLWELANIYRGLDFKNISEKIDFTIGFVALKVFEEKEEQDNTKDKTKDYWTDLIQDINDKKKDRFLNNLTGYISRLESETEFKEFKELMDVVNLKISSKDSNNKLIFNVDDTIEIFEVVESMGRLHNSGFDLFGAVYEMFASNKEKSDFGEFFTRRHYTHAFTKLLLINEKSFNNEEFTILDPACGTGGFLTEAFKILKNNYYETNTLNEDSIEFLKENCFYGYDVKEENVSRSRLNMFLVGDGHTHISKKDTLRNKLKQESFDYIVTNPPYGNGNIEAETSAISTKRYEIAFISKILKLLKVNGKACIIIPDGFFENPSFGKYRVEILEKCNIQAIISLPKFAFAPYTKEKTYAIFLSKKNENNTIIQREKIWMYIIDNDGYANSDKRFPTKLKDENHKWLHDEIASWIDENGDEQLGILEERWLKFDDSKTNGTEWIDEKGITNTIRKGGFIAIKNINKKNYFNLLPEYHLRKKEPLFITLKDLDKEIDDIKNSLTTIF
ncbi:MAG: N-6 DNA methylase [Lutibacter sp.]|uniref:HsdM family class I SAM-dependent methyltransferase n=1 Tax=Lutibacter sp. TaxID=1925666 RepID=UPI0019E97C42|nr:N-6 DNA methylase [Lutibacter sp.]NOR28053.1 N-6 DNA methylase [Lutibacter sp.]